MPIYKVLDSHIHHDGKPYAPGDTIELTEEQAEKLRVMALPGDEQERAKLTNKELIVLLEERGAEIPAKPTKAQLLELLAASDEAAKEGK